jgi:hypothetical protein
LAKYPGVDDLEETIIDIFDTYDSVKRQADRNLDKTSKRWGLKSEILDDILQTIEQDENGDTVILY